MNNDNNINTIIINCPHCNEEVLIFSYEINCGIFRHGVFKENMQQIDPHLPEVYCNRLIEEDKIFGCGKPFKINRDIINNKIVYRVEICDYI